MKRILTIQDLSCLGKCSLTVAIPVISAMGIEAVALPTKLLSAHTAFEGFIAYDLSQHIREITDYWKAQGLQFDGIYIGYLGTEEAVESTIDIINKFKTKDCLVVVDPVLGDQGQLYPGFDMKYVAAMKRLCKIGDIITPNVTEAMLLTDGDPVAFDHDNFSYKEKKEIVKQIKAAGYERAIVTGVDWLDSKTGDKRISILGYDQKGDFEYAHQRLGERFHGTGDVFTSTFVGSMAKGHSMENAVKLAGSFTLDSVRATISAPDHNWYGVDFELALPKLINMINK